MSKYNANMIRRTVRRAEVTPDGIVIHVTKSFTNNDDQWHPTVDTESGAVHCDCPDFRFRRSAQEPTVHNPEVGCKHTRRAIQGCIRRGELNLPNVRDERRAAVDARWDAMSSQERFAVRSDF